MLCQRQALIGSFEPLTQEPKKTYHLPQKSRMDVFYTKGIRVYPTISHLIKYRAYCSPGAVLDTRENDQAGDLPTLRDSMWTLLKYTGILWHSLL